MNTRQRLKERAELLASLRQFFLEENVLEVESPLLAVGTTTDPYLNHFQVIGASKPKYLLSSPEFAMKRLLVEGSGSIFQICKAFRSEEEGRAHRSEFTMLEWYMLDWNLEQLMEQIERLLSGLLNFQGVHKKTYTECFHDVFSINPHQIEAVPLRKIVSDNFNVENIDAFSKDECLNLLFSEKIEKTFNKNILTFVFNFPESQSALAKTGKDENGNVVAKRFEVYCGGLELANAYQEEKSCDVLEKRFVAENNIREILGKKPVVIDSKFLAAMSKGLPECSGIALGVDRLLMLQKKKNDISEVLCF